MSESSGAKKSKNEARADVFQKVFAAKPAYKGTVMVGVNIKFPQVAVYGNARASQRISNVYRESAKQYCNFALHTLYDQAVKKYLYSLQQHFPFRAYQAEQTFEKQYNRAALMSICYDRYEFTAGAHGNTARHADTWQLSSAERLSLGDFFENSYYKSVFFEYITNDIKRQIDEGNNYYFDDYAKNVFRYFDENNFYLTDTGIAAFYPLYTIAAYAEGIPVFIVPYENLGQSLKSSIFV